MSVFTKNSKEDVKLVGVHLHSDVYNYLTLYTLAKGITKSSLLKGFIDKWIEEEKEEESELLAELVLRIQGEWRKEKKSHPRASFNDFITEAKEELQSKGLSSKQIKVVLSNFE